MEEPCLARSRSTQAGHSAFVLHKQLRRAGEGSGTKTSANKP